MAGDSSGAVYSADNSGYQSITGYVVSGDVTFVAQTSTLALDSGSEAGMTELGDSPSFADLIGESSEQSTALPLDSATTPDGSAQNDSGLDSDPEAESDDSNNPVIPGLTRNPALDLDSGSDSETAGSNLDSGSEAGMTEFDGSAQNDSSSLLGTSLFGLASPFLTLLGAPLTTLDAGTINSASIEVLYDGTVNKNGLMDGDDSAGNDSSLTNNIVRNNDYIGYKLNYVAGTAGEVTVVIQLPDGMEWDSSALEGVKQPGSSISNGGKTLTVVRDVNGSASLELKARVYNHIQGDTVTLVGAEIGGKTATGIAATTVNVSAAPNYVFSFTNAAVSGGIETPGPNMGAGYDYSGEESRLLELGVEIYAPIDANKGVKGIAPLTSVTFQLNSTIAGVFATSNFGATQGGLGGVPATAKGGTWTPASLAVINTQSYTVTGTDWTSFKDPAATTNHNGTAVDPANAYFIAARSLKAWFPPASLTDGGTKPTSVVFDLASTTAGVSSGTAADTNYSGDGIKNRMSHTIPALSDQLIITTNTRGQDPIANVALHKGETLTISTRLTFYALTPSQTNAVFYSTWDDTVAEYDTRGVVSSSQSYGSPVTWTYEYGHVADYTTIPPAGTTWYATPQAVLSAGLSINAVRAIPTSTADPTVSIQKASGYYVIGIPAVIKADATATTFAQRAFYVSDQKPSALNASRTGAINPAGIKVGLAWENEFNGANVQKPGPQQVLKLTPWVAGNSAYTYNSRNYLTPTTGTAEGLQVVVTIPDATHLSVNVPSLQTLLDSKYPGLGATVTGDTSSGSTVLIFNFGRVVGTGYLPTLDIPVEVPLDTSVGTRTATAVISSPSDNINQNYRTSSSQIAFNQIQEFAVQKTASELFAQSGDSVTWTLNYVNFSPAGAITNFKLVDVLPYVGDGRTTTGLTAPLQITGVNVGSSGATVEYTTDTLADVLSELATDGSGESGINWVTTAPAVGTVTAVRFNIATVANGATGSVSFTTELGLFKTGGVLNNDAYVTTKELEMPNVSAAPVVSSASTVFGTVYKDMDFSGDFTTAPADAPLQDVEVTLTTADVDLRTLLTGLFGGYTLTRTTDEFGAYSFADLPAGAYTVSAPAVSSFPDFKYIEPVDGTNSYDVTLAPSTAPRYNFGLQETLWNLFYEMNAPAGSTTTGVTLPTAQTGISTALASAAVGAPTNVPLRTDGAGTYSFAGWATSAARANSGTVDYLAAATVPAQPAGTDYELFAVWIYTATYWDLVFDNNAAAYPGANMSAVGLPANQTGISTANASANIAAPTGVPTIASGTYVFTGWNTLADGTGTAYEVGSPVPAQASGEVVRLYALWSFAGTFWNLSYNVNAPVGSTTDTVVLPTAQSNISTASPSAVVGAPTNVPLRTDGGGTYSFAGWATSAARANLGTVDYAATATVPAQLANTNYELFAVWTYTETYWDLVFDNNAAEYSGADMSAVGLPANQTGISTANASASITAPTGVPTLATGTYVFTGWNTAADGTGDTYEAGVTVPKQVADTVVKLYAQWNFAGTYWNLTYNVNAPADLTGTPVTPGNQMGISTGSASGAVGAITGTYPKSDGSGYYSFIGWATTAGGTVVYPLATAATDTVAAKAANVTYTLYAVWAPTATYWDLTYDANLPADVAATPVPTLPVDQTGISTASASGAVGAISGTYPKNDGSGRYSFIGWATTAGGAVTYPVATATTDTVAAQLAGTNYVLYAQWAFALDAYGYTITHHFIGGPQAGSAITVLTNSSALHGDYITAPTTATYPGYTYLSGHSSEVLTGTVGVTGLALHVYYQANIYTVSYNGNGNTAGTAPGLQFGEYMAGLSVAGQGSLSRAGYSFLGWSENSAAGAPTWGAGGIITLDRNYSLYAIWSLDPTYTVVYAAGGDNVVGLPTGATGIAPGTTITVGAAPTRTGFAFAGYAASTGATLQPGDYFSMPAANVTLTALWTPASFNVTYQAGGANVTSLPASGTYNAGDTVTVGAAPVRSGFTFEGYSSSIGGTVRPGNTFTMPASDVVLTATWDEIIISTNIPTTPAVVTPGTQVIAAALEQGIPVMNIFGNDIPLVRPAGYSSWSLFDLICTLLAIIALAIAGIYSLARRRDSEKDTDKDGMPKHYRLDKDGNIIYDEETKKTRPVFLIVTLVAAVIAIVLFLITQDITAPVVLFDIWSIVFAILAVAAIVFARLTFTKKKEEYKQDPTETETPNPATGASVA